MAKMRMIREYEAEDGTIFKTKAEVDAYEAKDTYKPLTMMKGVDVEEILSRSSDKGKARGDLIEKLAVLIRNKRVEDGDFKRKRPEKKKD